MKTPMFMKRLFLSLLFVSVLACGLKAQNDTLLRQVASHEELDLREVGLLAMPSQGVFMKVRNVLVSVDDGIEMARVTFPDSIYVDEIIWTGEDMLLKAGYEVYLWSNLDEPQMDFDTEDYEVFSWNEKKIFIVCHTLDSSLLYAGYIKHRKVKPLLKIDEDIISVSAVGNATLVVTTENIYLFTEKKCKLYLNFFAPVQSAVMTSKGLVFATEDMVCLLVGEGTFVPLFEAKTQQLLYDYKELYMLLDNGDLWAFDIDKFKLF